MCCEPLIKAECIKQHGIVAYWRHQAKIHEDNAAVCFHDDPVAQIRLKTMAEIFRACADGIANEPGAETDTITELERRIRERFCAEPNFPINRIKARHPHELGWLIAHRDIIDYLKSAGISDSDKAEGLNEDWAYLRWDPHHIRVLQAFANGDATTEEVEAAFDKHYRDEYRGRRWSYRAWRWITRPWRRGR